MVCDFWLSCLRTAVDKDPLWGPPFWELLSLERQIRRLVFIRQRVWVKAGMELVQPTKVVLPNELCGGPAKLGKYVPEGSMKDFISEETVGCKRCCLGVGPLILLICGP